MDAEELKEELNQQFRNKVHKWIDPESGVTLSKIRKIKKKLLDISLHPVLSRFLSLNLTAKIKQITTISQ